MSKKPTNLIYSLDDEPPRLSCVLSALQHILILAGKFSYPLVIAQTLQLDTAATANMIAMSMIAAGVGTFLQSLNRGPMGAGYLDPMGNGAAYIPVSVMAARSGSLSVLLGMTFFAGACEAAFSQFMKRLRVLFPPEVTGVVVTMVGISLIRLALTKAIGMEDYDPGTEASRYLIVLITMGLLIGLSVWGNNWLRMNAMLFAVVAGCIAAWITDVFGQVEFAKFSTAAWFSMPRVSVPHLSLDLALAVPFAVAAISTALKTSGELLLCQKINDADWKRVDIKPISKGLLAEATSTIFASLIGTMGQGSSASNVGLTVTAGVTSRRIGFYIGPILIGLAFCPKLATFLAVMPSPVIGSLIIIISCSTIMSGIQIFMTRIMDIRKVYVIGLALFAGLSIDLAPWYFADAPWWFRPLMQSSMSVTTFLAIFLNLLMRIGIASRKTLELNLLADGTKKIFDFMEEQGGHWGARKDVIKRASHAMGEFFEMMGLMDLEQKRLSAEASFDEFNLDIYFRYYGPPVDFERISQSNFDLEALLTNSTHLEELSARIIKGHVDKIQTSQKNGLSEVHFHFEH
jgi:NCS2 family nucleobase:cation symporter-2